MTQSADSPRSKNNASEDSTFISLHQHYYSELEPGFYEFTFTQTINGQEGLYHGRFSPKQFEKIYQRERTIFFGKDRFAFDKRWIKSYYPPENEYGGTYKFCLPHVVLLDAALPWEWSAKKSWSKDVEKPVPWLALLVFTLDDIDEISADESILNVVSRPVEELVKDRFDERILCYPTIKSLYAHENPPAPATGETNDAEKKPKNVQTIDVPKSLFNKVAPSFGDLPYLAHVRQVTVEARALKSTDRSNQGEYYSVVVANRLPRSTKTVVHLVSLLGMEDYLPGADGANKLPEVTQHVRLVTFANWTFGVNDEARDFEALVAETLDVKDAPAEDPSTLRLPTITPTNATADDQTVLQALKMGYIAMNHKTRMGDQTVSWYRGPFAPYQVADDLVPKTSRSADSLIRYDTTTGLYNVSYAAAWQLGRVMALQKIEVAQALHDWKIRQNLASIRQWEQRAIERALPEDVMVMVNSARSTAEETTPSSLATAVLRTLLRQEEKLVAETPQGGARASRQVEDRSGFPDVSASELREMLNDESARSLMGRSGSQEEELPESVRKFLAELSLFQGIPYNYLVPDERMLPLESLRFFHLDWNWCRCLRDGVLSIGRTNSSIRTLDSRNADYYEAETANISSEYRAKYLNIPNQIQARDFTGGGPVTGFIMHSTVVEDFPGMSVQAFSQPDRKNGPLQTLHYETIGKNIKLFLCKGVMTSIRFSLGNEELHYKVDQKEEGSTVRFRKYPLRNVDANGQLVGVSMTGDANIPFRVTDGVNKYVINIQLLAENLATATSKDKAKFTAADFAIQMISGTPIVDYTTNPPAQGNPGAPARQVVIDSQPIDPAAFLSPGAEGGEEDASAT
jgi:hypothetical protein